MFWQAVGTSSTPSHLPVLEGPGDCEGIGFLGEKEGARIGGWALPRAGSCVYLALTRNKTLFPPVPRTGSESLPLPLF